MKCPLCDNELYIIGDRGDNYSSEIKAPVGWDCPTRLKDLKPISWNGFEEDWEILESHYSVRGARATAIIAPFKIETWVVPEEYPGVSVVYRYSMNKGWVKVFSCPAISLESEQKLLARLKLLTIFS